MFTPRPLLRLKHMLRAAPSLIPRRCIESRSDRSPSTIGTVLARAATAAQLPMTDGSWKKKLQALPTADTPGTISGAKYLQLRDAGEFR